MLRGAIIKRTAAMNREDFLTRRPGMIGEERFRQYAVLIPLINISGVTHLIFEKRSNKLKRQPGEICFPGGKLEENETLRECAVRETEEELLISPDQIEVVGPVDIYISPFNLMVHPFIALIKDYRNTFSTDEVEEIIKVPIDFFRKQQPERFESTLVNEPPEDFPYEWIPGGVKYPWAKGIHDILFYRYEDIIIWGMTAQIAKSAVDLMDEYILNDGDF